jgi:hypothetical protein
VTKWRLVFGLQPTSPMRAKHETLCAMFMRVCCVPTCLQGVGLCICRGAGRATLQPSCHHEVP